MPTNNLLIDTLSDESRNRLLSSCTNVHLPLRMILQRQDSRPIYAYFPTSGFASVMAYVTDGSAIEVGLLGRESVVGGLALLGPAIPSTECLVQMAGAGYQIRFSSLQRLFNESEEIRERLLQSAQLQALTTHQIAACNKLHDAESRLARWLLMVHDRVKGRDLHLTQEFLAVMLGTRRTTVGLAASTLQRAGLITYSHGRVRLLSRRHLEEAACDCYAVVKRLFEEIYSELK